MCCINYSDIYIKTVLKGKMPMYQTTELESRSGSFMCHKTEPTYPI